jgi:hypothetical protein
VKVTDSDLRVMQGALKTYFSFNANKYFQLPIEPERSLIIY